MSSNTQLKVKRLVPHAVLPASGSAQAAGYDLASSETVAIWPGGTQVVKTGLSISVPHLTYGRVAPRSGLAVKNQIAVNAGVIDEDYRGEVGVVLVNHGKSVFHVNPGDRIAQLVLEKIEKPEVVEVDNLDETERGAGGYGSTGIKSQ